MMKNLRFTILLLLGCQLSLAQYENCIVLRDNSDATDVDFIEIGNVETSSETGNQVITNYTVELWMNASELYQYGPNFGAEQDQAAGLRFRFTTAGAFSWWVNGRTTGISSADEHKPKILSYINTGWVHVALTYEETNEVTGTGTGILYLNGDSILSGPIATPQDGFKGFRLGTDGTTSSNYMNRRFTGLIDEFSIWRTTRSKKQVRTDKSDVLDATSEGLLIYYNFNDVNETTVVNQANPGTYDATIVKFDGNTESVYQKSDLVGEAWLKAPLPSAFTTTVTHQTFGELKLELYKYNIRGDGLKIFTCKNKGAEMTLYTDRVDTIEVRTYRGRISNLPNARVFASVYPDRKLYAKVYFGKGERDGFVINGASMEMTPADIEPVNEMYKAHNHIKAGFTPDSSWFAKKNYDPEYALAVISQAVNGMDYILARDFNMSMELSIYVLPLDDKLYDKNTSPIWTNTFWYTYGSGGSCGRNSLCDGNKGGRTSIGDIAFGSFSHEFGHLLDFGHYHNQWDCMHSNMDWFGRENSVKGRLNINSEGNACTISEDNYQDPVHPYAAEDYFISVPDATTEVDVLANDFDSNPGDVLSIRSFQSQSKQGGTIEQVGDRLQYTPPSGFIGRDYFSYVVQSGTEENGTLLWNNTTVMMDVRDENLALYYSFDETAGNIVVDRGWGISQNNGYLLNATFGENSVDGKVGKALQLNGIDECVEMPDVLDPIDGSLTVSVWFKLDAIPGSKESMLVFDTGSKGTLTAQGLSIALTSDAIGFYAQPEELDLGGCQLTKTLSWQTEKWYHAVLVVNRENHMLEAYLDNQKLTDTDYTAAFQAHHTIKGYPGKISGRVASTLGTESKTDPGSIEKNMLKGAIDELRIYTKALNEAEVTALYGAVIEPSANCPVGLFDNPILNAGFEADVVKHNALKSSIDYGWYYSSKANVSALWSEYIAGYPTAAEGDNWGLIESGYELYQQVGFLESNNSYTLQMELGKVPDLAFSGLKISLWAGVYIQTQNSPFSEQDMTKLSEAVVETSFLGGETSKQLNCELNIGAVVGDCTPVWLRIECPSVVSGSVLLDDIRLELTNQVPTNIKQKPEEKAHLGQLYFEGKQAMLKINHDQVEVLIYSMQGQNVYQRKANRGSMRIPNSYGIMAGIVVLRKEGLVESYKFLM
jgi:hypothetical protein